MPVGCPGDSRTWNAGPAARGSVIGGTDIGQPSRLGLRGLDATTPVAVRTSHSWEQINAFVTQWTMLLAGSASPSWAPIQSATEA